MYSIISLLSECSTFVLKGPPALAKNISIIFLNEKFNSDVQVDINHRYIRGNVATSIHVADSGALFRNFLHRLDR